MGEMAEPTSTETMPPKIPVAEPRRSNRVLRTLGIVAIVVVIVAIVSVVLYGLASHPPFTSVLRDIAIIVLALVTIVTGIFLAVLIIQLQSLIVLLRDEIYPILDSVNQTANTVRGTTDFVSDAVVSPLISAASYASAVRHTFRALTGSRDKRKPPVPPQSQE